MFNSYYTIRTVPIYFGSRFVFGKTNAFKQTNVILIPHLTKLFANFSCQSEIFNPKAFIYYDLDIPHQALSLIQYYEQNPSEYERMLNEPILAHGQETIEKYFSFDETVGGGMLRSRIRNLVGLT